MTESENEWHNIYTNLPDQARWAIDAAFDAACAELNKRGLPTSNSDQAEILVSAITRYTPEGMREQKPIQELERQRLTA